MRKGMKMALVLAMALVPAACETAKINPTAGGGGLDGRWSPDTGGYAAEFQNGAFRTLASDTGNVISQGSYIVMSENDVELSWTSNITGQPNTAKCARPAANLLHCTDGGGKTFTLRRI